MIRRLVQNLVIVGLVAGLAACAGRSPTPSGQALEHGTYKVGQPYEVSGVWYYPAVDWNYDETGIASWYGKEFHGRSTANGEIFDLNALTAAHPTLPMPSIVQVTNLENGRSIELRVNDRGPYVNGRIIDVSRRAAQLLG
ncbi:MAG TPA: septal ring lytic transglycosylase RlpA family protein, partial [Stellaceae bacterium]|nr:septal ring lytic transglycosylase RlpA family protein [Stellaceae bacterium]